MPSSRLSRGPCRLMSLPVEPGSGPASGLTSPSSDLISSVWPLPWTPAMPSTSPARASNETSLTTWCPRGSMTVTPRDLEHGVARPRRRPCDAQADLAADHHLGQLGLAGGRRRGADDLAAPDDADPVADRLDLAQLVGDEDDRGALRLERAHDVHQLVDLLRREHRRGLVEDQHLGVVGQRLEDLDALLHPDRQVLDEGVGVDREAVALGQLADRCGGRARSRTPAAAGLLAPEHHVLGDGEDRDQHEVLVHHADARRRSRRRAR